MDQFGDVILSWSSGYDGSPVHFLDNKTICFVNGNCVKFINVQNDHIEYLPVPGDSIANLTVNSFYKLVAFTEEGIDAKIFVYDAENLKESKVTLKGTGECLGYSALSFANNGSLLASCSNIPESRLTLWNWVDGKELCVCTLDTMLLSITFNPLNWKQMCGTDENNVNLWNIEQVNGNYHMQKKSFVLPRVDGTFGLEYLDGDCSNTDHASVYLTITAIAGLVKSGKEKNYTVDEAERCKPLSHCWAPNNQLLCSTLNGYLLSIDIESQLVTILDQASDMEFNIGHIRLHADGLFSGGKDGVIYRLKIHDNSFKIKERINIGKPISSLSFSTDYTTLAISGDLGFISVYQKDSGVRKLLEDDYCGEIVGVVCLGGVNQCLVTGRSEGLLQIWSTKDSKYIGKYNLNCKITCIASPASCSAIYAGTSYGSVVAVRCVNSSQLECVHEIQLHEGPITFLKIDETGTLMLTTSTDGHMFFIEARISTKLRVIGFTDFHGMVGCLSLKSLHEHGEIGPWKVVVGLKTVDYNPGCNQLIDLNITRELFAGQARLFIDNTKHLKDLSVNKRTFVLKTSIYDVCIVTNDLVVGIIHNGNRVAKFNLNQEQETTSTNLLLDASSTSPGHGLPNGKIELSCHGKWLVTCAPDGNMMLRAVGAMNNTVCVIAGNHRSGGIEHARFTADAQGILTVSARGAITCWTWKHTSFGKSKAIVAIETYRSNVAEAKAMKNEDDAFILKMQPISLAKSESKTWLQQEIEKSRQKEDQKYSSVKTSLRSDIDKLRTEVVSMIATNDGLADIEQLDRYEFNMDIEERNFLLQEREKALNELRLSVELKDTAKQYHQHLIKTDCWDNMMVKGRSVKGFGVIVEVSNYPMIERTSQDLEELQYVTQIRKIDEIDTEIRKSIFTPEFATYKSLLETVDTEGDEESADNDTKKESVATYGSLGPSFGGGNPLLQNQFTLHAKMPKKLQIVLLKDCIYNIKESFNKQFNEVFSAKLQEIKRIEDRNVRIQKIMNDLNIDEPIVSVQLADCEKPENLLVVDDHEVPFEKHISEEERLRLEEQARIKEERRLAENVDNLRGRALEMMMAGTLEIDIEDELKKDIEKPEFITNKPQEKWNEDEQKLAKEYEKNTSQLAEEREKYRKSLELELKKLQTTNIEATTVFDERLNQLFQRKIKTEAVVLQEELKIVRLRSSILLDEELEAAELELQTNLEMRKEEKQQSAAEVLEARQQVDVFRDAYETLLADDKTFDKMFRKEFSELDNHTVDMLYRLFKKRPRGQRALKGTVDANIDQNIQHAEGNPFQYRPSSSRAASAAASNLEKSLRDLDSEHYIPENVAMETWNHLVSLRRTKIEKEQQLRSKALILADMNAFLQEKIEDDDCLKSDIEKSFENIQRIRDERLRFNLNLEVQLLLKQGQIEVGKCDFVHSYTDSLLIHRSVVEELNAVIKTLGESKLASMRESKEFRKGIHTLAWDLKELYMRAEDLQTTAMDLQLLRVTKQLQTYLGEDDQRQSKQQEIATLEKTLDAYANMHAKKVNDKKRVVRKLRHQIKERVDKNNQLDEDIEELAIGVAERKNIDNVNEKKKRDGVEDKQMQNILTRRKLVDLARTQACEIGILRSEVERLRMRTFPALVQLK